MNRYRNRLCSVFVFCFILFSIPVAFSAGAIDPNAEVREATTLDYYLLVLYILLALLFSFLCSVAEAVLLSITPSFIAGIRAGNPKRADLLKSIRQDNVDRSLAAILTLNTIAHTFGAMGAGAQGLIVFGSVWAGLFNAVMTLMILFLSEIVPKTLGAVYWRSLTTPTTYFIRILIVSMYPLIVMSEVITRIISQNKNLHVFNREEFIAMATQAERSGGLQAEQSRIIRNLFRLDLLKAEDIMTPRTVMMTLHHSMTVQEALDKFLEAPFSRYPLYEAEKDQYIGFILKSDVLKKSLKGETGTPLTELTREIIHVPALMNLSALLDTLLDQRHHISLVVDEYGVPKGLVTLEDVVETLLGMEIVDEVDKVEDMQNLARQQWKRRARALGLEVET